MKESIPEVFARPQQDLITKLGLIVIAEKIMPQVFEDTPYEQTLERLREVTKESSSNKEE